MEKKLKSSAQKIQDILHTHNLNMKVIDFAETTRTSQDAANAIGCDIGQIAKTLIFKTKFTEKPISIIASGKNKVDENKIALILGQVVEKPDAEFVLKHTGFAIGGVPPIGYELEIKPIIDEDLMDYSEIWAAAGTPHSVFCLSPKNLLLIAGGRIMDVKK